MPISSEEFIWIWACSECENLAVVLSAPLALCRFEATGSYWTTLPLSHKKNMLKAIKHRNVGNDTKDEKIFIVYFSLFSDLSDQIFHAELFCNYIGSRLQRATLFIRMCSL